MERNSGQGREHGGSGAQSLWMTTAKSDGQVEEMGFCKGFNEGSVA